jgi:NADPH-dependent 2,4-dienoyl-CoA reductase/sulfur reductase-like enzyme
MVQTVERTEDRAAAKTGADVVLLERYNHLGGLSTGGPEVRNP